MADQSLYRSVERVVEAVKSANERKGGKGGCSLLLGAGCSASAGIPVASRFIEIIKERFPRAAMHARRDTYPELMASLSPDERRGLIKGFIDKARINTTHLAISGLLKAGYIDRILTVNFDPLVQQASALANVAVATYDFASSRRFDPANVPSPAVFHLHGQHTGFVILNTREEVRELRRAIVPVFSDAGQGRVWIVVGYSGDNDPVFRQLARVRRFDPGLRRRIMFRTVFCSEESTPTT
jgi:hypothetical protein